jgi:putative colanic acid biosysnthesis UDP-glucose lipid carrier transferase
MFVDFDLRQFADGSTYSNAKVVNRSNVQSFLKRLTDITISLIALLCLAPLFLILACLIKAENHGPVFFRQVRNGKAGKTFSILKFRSMAHENDAQEFAQCEAGDSRVTLIGRIIRKTSIDELPQLINVLSGQMSIVGPRPHVPEMDEGFANLVPNYMDRYSVKPGITGLAQVRGLRGPTPNTETMAIRIFADLEYARNVTFLRDMAIMLRTIPAVLFPKNAH